MNERAPPHQLALDLESFDEWFRNLPRTLRGEPESPTRPAPRKPKPGSAGSPEQSETAHTRAKSTSSITSAASS